MCRIRGICAGGTDGTRRRGHLGQIADRVLADRAPLARRQAFTHQDPLDAEFGKDHDAVVVTEPQSELVVQLSCQVLDALPDGQPLDPSPVPAVRLPRRPLETADLVCQSTKQFRATATSIFVVIVHAPLHDAFTPPGC